MRINIDDLLPTAKEVQKQAALKEAEKADEHAQRLLAAEAEKRALIEQAEQAFRALGRGEGQACLDRHPASGTKRA